MRPADGRCTMCRDYLDQYAYCSRCEVPFRAHCTDGPAYIEDRDVGDPVCHDCGEPHWYNVWVPDDVWPRIMPDQDDPRVGGGGVLCARCIDRRCVEAGLQDVRVRFHFTGKAVRSHGGG